MKKFEEAVDRAFERTESVLTAIEERDADKTKESIKEMGEAQAWDLVAIGQSFVRDQVQIERDQDDGNQQPRPSN